MFPNSILIPQVSVFGGYTDERGDAARNSMSLLEALHDQERTLEVCLNDTSRCLMLIMVENIPASRVLRGSV